MSGQGRIRCVRLATTGEVLFEHKDPDVVLDWWSRDTEYRYVVNPYEVAMEFKKEFFSREARDEIWVTELL